MTDLLVVPHPRFRVDGLADRPQEPQRAEVVRGGPFITPLHEGADRGRRRVKNVHGVALDHLPEAPLIGRVRGALVHDGGGPIGERPVDEIAMPGHPADIRGTPVDVLRLEIEHILRGEVRVRHVAAGRVDDAFWLARRSAGIEEEEHVFGVHLLGRAKVDFVSEDLVIPVVATFRHLARIRVAGRSLDDDHVVDAVARGDGLIDDVL